MFDESNLFQSLGATIQKALLPIRGEVGQGTGRWGGECQGGSSEIATIGGGEVTTIKKGSMTFYMQWKRFWGKNGNKIYRKSLDITKTKITWTI